VTYPQNAAGLVVSSYRIDHDASARDPVRANVAGNQLLKQAVKLGETVNGAAVTHKTVGQATHLGVAKTNASTLDGKAAPLKHCWMRCRAWSRAMAVISFRT
jgi:hypothetical protein